MFAGISLVAVPLFPRVLRDRLHDPIDHAKEQNSERFSGDRSIVDPFITKTSSAFSKMLAPFRAIRAYAKRLVFSLCRAI